jgi:hypothetical protein
MRNGRRERKKIVPRLVPVLLVLCLAAGCPLTSEFPLGDSKGAPMDERLLGKWVESGSKKSPRGTIAIYRFNESEYYLEVVEPEDKGTSRYRGFLTAVDNVRILNVQELHDKASEGKYRFVKISLSPDNVLALSTIEDNLLSGRKISSRNDLLSYVRNNMNDPKLFSPLCSLGREGK